MNIRFLYIYRVCPSQFATGRIEDEHYLGGRPATTRPRHHYPLSPGTGTYPRVAWNRLPGTLSD